MLETSKFAKSLYPGAIYFSLYYTKHKKFKRELNCLQTLPNI